MNGIADAEIQPLCNDGEFLVSRSQMADGSGTRLLISPLPDRPSSESFAKLEHSLALRSELDEAWAARPSEFVKVNGRQVLLAEDPGGEFLSQLIGEPIGPGDFLRLAIGISSAIGGMHARGLVHKDIKPSNVIVKIATGEAWLTGFGLTSRLPRYRQPVVPPENVAGTLAYMAPEQTGRMNRSVDSRSDLYSFGIALYEVLTGRLPFTAGSPMEWVHCHTARRPPAPMELSLGIPSAISDIVMKLLSKAAEDRYQSAAGLENDLRRCLSDWEISGRIDNFKLGECDHSDRLLIPERLYGREREIDTLLSAFDRVVAGGQTELVLVSGYSGVGKSALVNELHKHLVPPRGLFASGKFDQYKREIPYATLAQAFQSLIRPLLSKGDEELEMWRGVLLEALDPNGALIGELVPDLLHIIGRQPPVPELPTRDAQARFHLVLRRFIEVFAKPEHPLAIFLDDLQWLDAATLDFLEDILAQPDLKHLLLIGSYRDNEVHATHPLTRKLDAIRRAGAKLHNIVLTPLGSEDTCRLLADSIRGEPEQAAPLARLIHEKTSGNPFFAIQFIATLADEALLVFEHATARWVWDLKKIREKGFTDNVVDLMVGKLGRLSLETQGALRRFACLGNSADFAMLRMVDQGTEAEMHEHLWEAVRAGLVVRSDTSYRFLHDRVQEAAYSLIPEDERAQAHLRIGRLLAEHTPAARRGEAIFEIVNQLNRGAHLLASIEECEWVAGLNLLAAKRAKHSTAYAAALNHLGAGRPLLTEATWDRNYDLIFSIECLMAECELLTAQMTGAENRLTMLARRATSRHDFAVVTRLQLTLYTTLDRSELAIDIALEYLRREGTVWSHHPTRDDVMREYDRVWELLGDRQIEDLVDLPELTDPDVIDMLDVFTEIVHPAMFYDENLSSLVACRMVCLSLEHGNCEGSPFGYVWFAMFAGPRFNDYERAFRFGQLGYNLVETRGFERYQARTYLTFATLTPWGRHAAQARELIRRAFDVAYRMGDLTFSTYSWHALITNFLAVGDPLKLAQAEAETGLAFARKTGFGLVVANCLTQLGLIRTLRGLTPTFGCFDDGNYNEADAEAEYANNPVLVLSECFYWTRKLQARFFSGDYSIAIAAAQRAEAILWTAASQVEMGDLRFYAALAYAGGWNSAPADEKQGIFDSLIEHARQIEIWAKHSPSNFENRHFLVSAEIARVEDRILDAEHLYEKAIHSARENGFVHNEALCHELAAQFYSARGFRTISETYFGNARSCYEQWGARGKAAQLDSRFPSLRKHSIESAVGTTIDSPVAQLDAEIVLKASQTLSSEINLTVLIEKLMRLAVEYAGAQRGVLILLDGEVPYIEGEARFESGCLEISQHRIALQTGGLFEAALQLGLRTRERVLFDDAGAHPSYASDEYVRLKNLRSVLCVPILKQTQVIGALYFENNLMTHAFTEGRVVVLEVLASQAAISLENARLYAALEQENRDRKRAEEAVGENARHLNRIINTIPTMVWSARPDGSCYFFNHRWLEYTGFTMEKALGWGWTEAFHPDDVKEDVLAYWQFCLTTGTPVNTELRMRRHDGVYRMFLLLGAPLRDEAGEIRGWYGTNIEIEDRKQAEEDLRRSEAFLAEGQRVSLTGSFSWNLNQNSITFSAECCRIFGFAPDEAVTMEQIGERLHPDDLPMLAVKTEEARTLRNDHDYEIRLRMPDGTIKHLHSISRPVSTRDGNLEYVGTIQDVTSRYLAEEQVRKSELHLRQMTETIPEMLWSATAEGDIDYCNGRLLEYTGFSASEVMGGGWTKLLHPDDVEQTAREWFSCVATGKQYVVEVRTLHAADRSYRWCITSALPLFDAQGRIVKWYGTVVDMHDRKRADEELRRSELRLREVQDELAHVTRVTTMGELAASIAHEINQPITGVVINANTSLRWLSRVKEDSTDLKEARETIERILRDGVRAGEIIARIRALFKKAELAKEPLDLNEAVEEIIVLARNEIDKQKVSLELELSRELPIVLGDRVQLQQVMLNLILNAVDAMSVVQDRARNLTISTKPHGESEVVLTVRDSGVGLSPESAESIFTAFHTTKAGGLGMGLPISRTIVENHSGRLWVTGHDGPGASFHFTLPIVSAQ